MSDKRIRRILVAIDASPCSLSATEAAAELAALLDAELKGLFVRDDALLELSEHPLARAVDPLTTTIREVGGGHLERHLRVQAMRARSALARLAARVGIRWSFEIATGIVSSTLQAAAGEADIVSVGRTGWSFRSGRALGSTARTALSWERTHVLVLGRARPIRPPVIVLYESSAAAREALSIATRLAERRSWPLIVLLSGPDEQALRDEVGAEVSGLGERVRQIYLGLADGERLAQIARGEHRGVLIVPADSRLLAPERLLALLDRVDSPVMVIRARP
ncbi:MAG: universal stress protein [Acidobacteriota bacterium]|nr:MAG: universal stress protein [Acidobacteriota bacterium]